MVILLLSSLLSEGRWRGETVSSSRTQVIEVMPRESRTSKLIKCVSRWAGHLKDCNPLYPMDTHIPLSAQPPRPTSSCSLPIESGEAGLETRATNGVVSLYCS